VDTGNQVMETVHFEVRGAQVAAGRGPARDKRRRTQ
jgi:hypothetical protein